MFKRLAAILTVLVLLPLWAVADTAVMLPDFTMHDQYGREWTLADLEGKTVFLNFWTTWCPYCVQEMPDIEQLYHETGENRGDILILGIDTPSIVDNVDEAGIIGFLEENGYTYPTLIDADASLLFFFGVSALPTTYIINGDGVVLFNTVGMMDPDTMREIIGMGMAGQE